MRAAPTHNRNARVPGQDRWSRLAERARISWERLFGRGDFITLLVALGVLLMPALSLWAADWPLDMGIVLPVLGLSLGFGFLLARSQYNELLALMMSSIYGGVFVLLVAALNQPGGLRSGAYEVFNRVVLWAFAAANEGVNPDDLVFTMLVATLFWFLGYNVAWHLFRVDRLFRVLMPPGLILLTNTVYYNGNSNLNPYVVMFLFLGLLLSVRSHLEAQEWEWYTSGLRVPRRVRWQVNLVGALLALLVVAGGWSIPNNDLQQRLDRFQEFMQADPFQQVSEVWNRLFSTIDAYGPVTADYYGGDSLALSGAIQLGDQVVMQVRAPNERRYYWRSRVYDTYNQGNWTSQAMKRVPYLDTPVNIETSATADTARVPVEQRFTLGLSASRLVYAAPQPASVSVGVRSDLRYLDPAEAVANLYVIRPFHILERNDTYTATSLMTTATASQLNAAPTDYPAWITESQLYVPPSVTGRTLALAQEIVNQAGAVTPYDKAKAIETWLRTNMVYNETIPQPPINQDPIDWFLFDYREGYCNYYASSMVMMLRSQGIPTRMAAGFAEGDWDGSQYIVRERDAHTWVEVYFPGYGWIEFEPTAAQAPLNRGDEQTTPSLPTPTPPATATPTLTPTSTPTLTPSPTTDATLAPPENEALVPPTSTPTLTPTPTATPVIIPTQPPQLTDNQRSPVAFILPAILTALAVLAVLALIVLVLGFIWWWYEWRGTRGFTPIRRVYTRLERYVLTLLRLPLRDEETPNERGRRIVESLPPKAQRPVSAITQMYMQERYGRPEDAAQVEKQAERAWQDARRNILTQWIQRVFPPARWLMRDRQ